MQLSQYPIVIRPSFVWFLPLGGIPMAISSFGMMLYFQGKVDAKIFLAAFVLVVPLMVWYFSHSVLISINEVIYYEFFRKKKIEVNSKTVYSICTKTTKSSYRLPFPVLLVKTKSTRPYQTVEINAQVFGPKKINQIIRLLDEVSKVS